MFLINQNENLMNRTIYWTLLALQFIWIDGITAQNYDYTVTVTDIAWTGDYDFFTNESYAATIDGNCDASTRASGNNSASASPNITVDVGSSSAGNMLTVTFNYAAWENDGLTDDLCDNDDGCFFCDGDNTICDGTFTDDYTFAANLTVGTIITLTGGGTNSCSANDGTFSMTIELEITAAMPIELVSFTGEVVKEHVQLDWITMNEHNNEYMAVEHSDDGKSFVEIGHVNGQGSSSIRQNYHFVDEQPTPGVNYYRLVQYDFDGTSRIHPILKIELEHKDIGSINARVYPNPAVSTTVVAWDADEHNITEIYLYDLNGRVQRFYRQAPGSQRLDLDLTNLPAGHYIVRIQQHAATKLLRVQKLPGA